MFYDADKKNIITKKDHLKMCSKMCFSIKAHAAVYNCAVALCFGARFIFVIALGSAYICTYVLVGSA